MQVHEVEGNPALQITVDMTECNLITNVPNSQIREVRLCNGLIYGFIFFYPTQEVLLGCLTRHVFIIGITRADLQGDVGGYNGWVIADGLKKDDYDPSFLGNSLFELGPERACIRIYKHAMVL